MKKLMLVFILILSIAVYAVVGYKFKIISTQSGTFYTNEINFDGSCVRFFSETATDLIWVCGTFTVYEKSYWWVEVKK